MHLRQNFFEALDGDPDNRFAGLWQRGMQVATRLAISFALAVVVAVGVGAAATDNAFAQILLTAFVACALWLPLFFLIVGAERLYARRSGPRQPVAVSDGISSVSGDQIWRRLATMAPNHAERVAVLKRSIDRSRLALGTAQLDPDAHEICLLIDRRLPELIDRELADLPPDDRDRDRQISELISLIEQFARDCSRRGSANSPTDRYSAEVLRRRFETHLTSF